jgi:SAM-dependent methyltransferase
MDSKEAAAFWESNAETWTRHARLGFDVYRDFLNTPAFLAMLPPVAGCKGLDIGCGEGTNTRKLAQLGAGMTAVDIAPTFIRHAQAAEDAQPLGIRYWVADAQELPFGDASFDFAVAFMSIMDMAGTARVFHEVARVLRPGGFFQFSILHPCFAPPHRRVVRDAEGCTIHVELARYFDEVEGEVEVWKFSAAPEEERDKVEPFRVPRFHRTLSRWVGLILAAGFAIEAFAEPRASEESAARFPIIEDTRHFPLTLIVRARKAAVSR